MICIRVHVAPSRTFAVPFSLVLYGPHKMLLCSRSFLNTSLYASNTVTPPPQGIPFWGEGMWGVFMDIPKRLLNHLNQPPIPPTASSSRFQWYPALPKPLLSFLCSPHPASWLSCLGLCRTLLRKKYKAIDNTAQTIYVCHTYVCCVCMSVYLYIYMRVLYANVGLNFRLLNSAHSNLSKSISSSKNNTQNSCQMSNCLLGGIPVALKAFKISSPEDKSLGMPSL